MALMIIALICITSVFLFAAYIHLHSRRNSFNNFVTFSIALACIWTICINVQATTLFTAPLNTFLGKISFVAVSLLLLTLFKAFAADTGNTRQPWYTYVIYGITFTMVSLSLSNAIVTGYDTENLHIIVERGNIYWLFISLLITMVVSVISRAVITIRHTQGPLKIRTLYLLIATVLAFASGLTTNLILPNINPNTSSVRYAFVSIVIWCFVLAYGILHTELTDIKSALYRTFIRSATFTISLLIFISLFITLARDTVGLTVVAAMFSLAVYSVIEGILLSHHQVTPVGRADEMRAKINDFAFVKESPLQFEQATCHLLAKHYQIIITPNTTVQYEQTRSARSAVTILSIYRDSRPNTKEFFQGHEGIVFISGSNHQALRSYFIDSRPPKAYLPSIEIEELRQIFQLFAIQYENKVQFEEIESFNTVLQERIADATKELKHQNRQLKEFDQAKNEFISIASHQLRTPLTSVKGYLSMILTGDAGPLNETQKKMLNQAFASSQRMVYLIGDFLNLSRIQSGKLQFDRHQADLATTVREEVTSLRAAAAGRNVKLTVKLPDTPCVLEFDENKIRQVIMNFIDNAIFYTSAKNGIVTITLERGTRYVEFRVEDNGIGVPKAEQPKLFQKFFRASNARSRRPDGTGVGLFMAKKIIAGHGGEIIFHSVEGKGSTFGFKLPLETK